MKENIEGVSVRRSNKDLGRVIALAALRDQQEEDAVQRWPALWHLAMQELDAPEKTLALLRNVNAGVKELLESTENQIEALHALNNGLLSSRPWTREQMEIAIKRYLQWTR